MKRLLKNQTKSDGSNYDVHKDGLKIYTTIDARMQKHAEAAAWNHLKSLQNTFFKHWKNKDDSGDDGASLKQLVQTFFYRMMLFLVKYLMQQTLENWLRGDNDNEANYFALISSLLLCLLSARRAYSEVKVGIGKKE